MSSDDFVIMLRIRLLLQKNSSLSIRGRSFSYWSLVGGPYFGGRFFRIFWFTCSIDRSIDPAFLVYIVKPALEAKTIRKIGNARDDGSGTVSELTLELSLGWEAVLLDMKTQSSVWCRGRMFLVSYSTSVIDHYRISSNQKSNGLYALPVL